MSIKIRENLNTFSEEQKRRQTLARETVDRIIAETPRQISTEMYVRTVALEAYAAGWNNKAFELADQAVEGMPNRVSIHGMFDMHLFHRYEGRTVDEVIANWKAHIAKPIPAIVGGVKHDDLGPTYLCPAIVLAGDKELRRVGEGVFIRKGRTPEPSDVAKYRHSLLSDPDISRILAATGGK